jgi:hypothetical protein
MSGRIEVAPVRTSASPAELRAAIEGAAETVTGHAPSKAFVDVLTAQASLETGHGAHMWNWNFGGIKGASPAGETAHLKTKEVEDGKEISIVDGFRAYGSIDEGARDYVHTLQTRFSTAFSAAERGDVTGFAHALKRSGYYTASEASYRDALLGITGHSPPPNSAAGPPPIDRAPPLPPPDMETVARVMEAISADAARIAAPAPEESTNRG